MATKTQTVDVKAQFTGLSKDEILRYSRHLIMPEVGTEGQLKLKAAKVLRFENTAELRKERREKKCQSK